VLSWEDEDHDRPAQPLKTAHVANKVLPKDHILAEVDGFGNVWFVAGDLKLPEDVKKRIEAEQEEELLFDALLLVRYLHKLFHDVPQVLFIVNILG
jgi:hypothetical protein